MRHTISLVDRSIRVKTGSEGPRHDPYSYTEYTLVRDGQPDLTLHAGLVVWIKGDGCQETATDQQEENMLFGRFECEVGWSLRDLERWSAKAKQRCPKCHHKGGSWMAGYPGESFKLCDECGEVMDYQFCESAIE